jgi:glycosyltransferase involved in cell wall biosynthesis
MKRLLWIGDACCDSGFARATHNTLETLQHQFEVSVLGLNYLGDPHPYPYPIYPCWPGKDMFGIGRLKDADGVLARTKPDVIIIQNDPWNIPVYMHTLAQTAPNVPVIGILAVDGKNCRGGDPNGQTAKDRGLHTLVHAIFWTEFAQREARSGGYDGPSSVVPLGVDTSVYRPAPRDAARRAVGLPTDVFLVGNVNRNQPRKRLDLTLAYFAQWLRTYPHEDARLFLHVAPTGETAYDIDQLARYFDLKGRVILSEPGAYKGLPETRLALLYNCFDVGISTTQGEGFGLPTLEMMACGTPQIVPDWSALGEWTRPASTLVPCTSLACTPNEINVVGGIADGHAFVEALEAVYSSPVKQAQMAHAGLVLADLPCYRWSNIGQRIGAIVQGAVNGD